MKPVASTTALVGASRGISDPSCQMLPTIHTSSVTCTNKYLLSLASQPRNLLRISPAHQRVVPSCPSRHEHVEPTQIPGPSLPLPEQVAAGNSQWGLPEFPAGMTHFHWSNLSGCAAVSSSLQQQTAPTQHFGWIFHRPHEPGTFARSTSIYNLIPSLLARAIFLNCAISSRPLPRCKTLDHTRRRHA